MLFSGELMNNTQQCNRGNTIYLFWTKNGGRDSVCLYTDNEFWTSYSCSLPPYIWMSKVVKFLCSLVHVVLRPPACLLSSVHRPAFFRDKTPVIPKPRVSASVMIYENTLLLETYLFILNWTSSDLNFIGHIWQDGHCWGYSSFCCCLLKSGSALVAGVDGRAFCISLILTFRRGTLTRVIMTECGNLLHLVHWIDLDFFLAAMAYKQNEGVFWKRFHQFPIAWVTLFIPLSSPSPTQFVILSQQ